MKPTDPTPEEYTKWIDSTIEVKQFSPFLHHKVMKIILTELRDNSTTELNKLYFNECLTELKKL